MKWLTSLLLRMRRRTGFALIAISVAIVFEYHLGSGVVVDDSTGLPIEGVYVVARFTARAITPVNSSQVCFKVVSTRTDQAGSFMLWPISWNFNPLLWLRERQLLFYSKGYAVPEQGYLYPLRVSMGPQPGLDLARIESMHKVGRRLGCGSDAEQKEFVLPVYQAMVSEAEKIAESTGRPGFARGMRMYVYDLIGMPREK